MMKKIIGLIFVCMFVLSCFSTVNASDNYQIFRTVNIGDQITVADNEYSYPTVFLNSVQIWSMFDQATFVWSDWTDNIIPDLRGAGYTNSDGVFVKKGIYTHKYEWKSGFFNNNKHTTEFKFTVL